MAGYSNNDAPIIAQAENAEANNVKGIVGSRPMVVSQIPFVTAEELVRAQQFEGQQGDILISTFPKTGTTWMQQLCHQIRTGGHVDFEEVSEERIVPWLEISPALGIDSSLPQQASPRCFKTHQMLSALSYLEASGAKYLCVVRDPEATLVSFFKFKMMKRGEESGDVNDFIMSQVAQVNEAPDFGGYLWEFYAEYWRCRKLSNVLLVAYENLKKDTDVHIPLIANFMGLEVPDANAHAKIAELSSFAWMSKNDHLFDDHHIGLRLAATKGKGKGKGKGKDESSSIEEGANKGHPRATKVGLELGSAYNAVLTDATREHLDAMWKKIVTPVTGHATYSEMLSALTAEMQQAN